MQKHPWFGLCLGLSSTVMGRCFNKYDQGQDGWDVANSRRDKAAMEGMPGWGVLLPKQ